MQSLKYAKDNKEFFKFLQSGTVFTPHQKAIYGSIFGAFIGDAAGAYLEFFDKKIETKDVQTALTFNGGGAFRVGKAQITDDSEMAMCILHGLTDQQLWKRQYPLARGYPLNLDGITYYFGKWLYGRPFDIGMATRTALEAIEWETGNQENFNTDNPFNVMRQVRAYNSKSQSNGCLMRITPLAVWGHRLSSDQLLAAVRLQTMLTHSNDIALQASYLYCFAIQKLIEQPGQAQMAYQLTIKESERLGFTDMQQWFKDIEQGIFPPARKMMGWLKIAFTQAFKFLKSYPTDSDQKIQEKYFRETMEQVLILGGDTDTNAAIVGGLIGALVGIDKIEVEWIEKLLDFDCKNNSNCRNRDEFLIPKHHLVSLIDKIASNAPEHLAVQISGITIDDPDDITKLSNNTLKYLEEAKSQVYSKRPYGAKL